MNEESFEEIVCGDRFYGTISISEKAEYAYLKFDGYDRVTLAGGCQKVLKALFSEYEEQRDMKDGYLDFLTTPGNTEIWVKILKKDVKIVKELLIELIKDYGVRCPFLFPKETVRKKLREGLNEPEQFEGWSQGK